jgi:tetratricopeptide (TPR) repeat protein
LRQAVRFEIQQAVAKSPDAAAAQTDLCRFQVEHKPADAGPDITQYISLALELGAPPDFTPTLIEADLPPDAAHVLGVASLLQRFYRTTGLHDIWLKHQAEYDAQIRRFHSAVADALIGTDLYLKLASSGYGGRRFVIYLEPMLSPGQINSRNYGDNYFLVVSPSRENSVEALRLTEVRHTYLHYVLDPLALQHARSLKRLEPLAELIKEAPLDKSYKYDFALLVNESLIRAIEARTLLAGKTNAAARDEYVDHYMAEGFILTRYFYDALGPFEKESMGMKDAYGNLLYNISLEQERKRLRNIVFAAQATPEVVVTSRPGVREERFLDIAEQQLASGDTAGAQKLALQVLNNRNTTEDQGRALFILARAAAVTGDMRAARVYFERAAESAHDPRTLAWSHIYLGRILDLQESRDAALDHYRAALSAGDPTPDTRSAAEKGLAAPYQPPARTPR